MLPQPRAKVPGRDLKSCVGELLQAKLEVSRRPVSKDALVKQIADEQYLDPELAERFPDAFLGRYAAVFGALTLQIDDATGASGRFLDRSTGRSYRARLEAASSEQVEAFVEHPGVTAWFWGRFERDGDGLTLIAQPTP